MQPWVRATQSASGYYMAILESLAKHYGFSTSVPVRELPEQAIKLILYGNGGEIIKVAFEGTNGRVRIHQMTFEGVIPNLKRRYSETGSDYVRDEIERYMTQRPCSTCKGSRLKPENLAVTIDHKSIVDITSMAITEALAPFVEGRVVWDLLPGEHAAAWAPALPASGAPGAPKALLTVRFLDEAAPAGGERRFTTVSHWNKLLKGALVRHVLATQLTDPDGLTGFTHPEGYTYDPSLTEERGGRVVLAFVRPAR